MDVFLTGIVNYLVGLSATYPKMISVFAIAYMVGIVLKVLRSAVESYVLASPSRSDDASLAKLESGSIMKAVFFITDLLIRFKKPE